MFRRWPWRIGALLFAVVSAVVWVGSYRRSPTMWFVRSESGWNHVVMVSEGEITAGLLPGSAYDAPGWHFSANDWPSWGGLRFTMSPYAGFRFERGEHWVVQVPLWFVTAVFAVSFGVAVWVTGSMKRRAGFPVGWTREGDGVRGEDVDLANHSGVVFARRD